MQKIHCPLRREANTMVLAFLSVVAELCLIEMESFFASGRIVSDRNGEFCTFFGGWLAAPAGQALQ